MSFESTSPSAPDKGAGGARSRNSKSTGPVGRYEGVYTLDGFTLRRSDGTALCRCFRSGEQGSRGSRHFLTLASAPSRPFIGNLYRSPDLDGAEFDDRVHRYVIERVSPDSYRIRTLRRKGQRAPRRGRV